MAATRSMRPFVPAAIAASLLLAGCSSDEPPRLCPPVGTPAPLDSLTRFDPGGRDLTQVLYEARISGIESTCAYDSKGVEVSLTIGLVAERGPADRERRADLRYFVAIEDGVGNVTAKEIFDASLAFEGNTRRVGRAEEIELRIPVPGDHGFSTTRLLVGFQLTPEDLEHNRRSRR